MTMRSPGAVLPLFFGTQKPQDVGFSSALIESFAKISTARNLGGSEDSQPYRGFGGLLTEQVPTRELLKKLARRLMQGTGAADNPNIPSGYTYLAQLAAHDLVSTTTPLPRENDAASYFRRDYRINRLALDTIYGGGPVANPLPYAVDRSTAWRQRYLLRLGHIPCKESETAMPDPPMMDQPPRDIARAACPFLHDKPSRGVPDALLADPRNDDHLIIAQLTALFHELHNIVAGKLGGEPQNDFVAYRRFLDARNVVTLAYRKVIINDLMRRLLEDRVYQHYLTAPYPGGFIDHHDDGAVPVEFSHAAYRIGHVMVRFRYTLNGTGHNGGPQVPSMLDIIQRSSSREADRLPVATTWLIDWARFFQIDPAVQPNLSRRIVPHLGGALGSSGTFPNEDQADGGLIYRDLLRGADAGVRTVESMIQRLRAEDRERSELLRDPNKRRERIADWLTAANGHGFTDPEKSSLSENPPLLLFLLLEAALTQDGLRLGILGSTIVAEVFFAAYRIHHRSFEGDPNVVAMANGVFGGTIPADMPALIAFVKANGGLREPQCP